jgi:hypothetical protein
MMEGIKKKKKVANVIHADALCQREDHQAARKLAMITLRI